MITRSNLAEQLREYQIRSKHDWASVSFFSSTSNLPSSRYVKLFLFIFQNFVILFVQVYILTILALFTLLMSRFGIDVVRNLV